MASDVLPLEKVLAVDEAICHLASVAARYGATIYNICFRHIGWGIQWFEESRRSAGDNFRDGLIVYHYYPTIGQAINAEIERLTDEET